MSFTKKIPACQEYNEHMVIDQFDKVSSIGFKDMSLDS